MEDLPKELGVDITVLMSTQGSIATEKLPQLISSFKNKEITNNIKKQLSDGFGYWATMVSRPIVDKGIRTYINDILEVIYYLTTEEEDITKINENDYDGNLYYALKLIDSIKTAGSMDTTQQLVSFIAPLSYQYLEKFLQLELTLLDRSPFVKTQAGTERCQLYISMIQMLPYSGTVSIPNAILVISTILCGNYPQTLKQAAKTALQTMAQVNKEAMKNSGGLIMNIIATGQYDDLIFTFLSMPELYTNDSDGIHKHLDYILKMNWMYVGSIVNNIASAHAEVLTPYVSTIVSKINESPQLSAVTLMILKEISKVSPNDVFPHIQSIITAANGTHSYLVAGCISACSRSTCVFEFNPGDINQTIGDLMFDELMKLLTNSSDSVSIITILSEVLNVKDSLSSREKLTPYMTLISSHKSSNDVVVTSIEDFYAGRSLASLELRVDSMEEMINQMNTKIAESCANFEDVVAYIDAHVADLKDFIGDVVKKLPSPKRLEVVGTLRKTLILHFECVHTGYEFPIVSYEWNKWLKMGFSLAKAGKAVFDIGTGNPLGLLSTGIECVQGIYNAYKTNDDDEFNTYITNPFLTSTEQDQLIEKLRSQGFFDKMAYDNQAPGWYLINPEVDGTPPGGEAGGVTHVSSKEGYGIINTITNLIEDKIGSDSMDIIRDVSEAVVTATKKESESTEIENPIVTTSSPKATPKTQSQTPSAQAKSTPVSPVKAGGSSSGGGRAAAIRLEMSQSGALNEQVATEKFQRADQIASLQSTVSDLESRLAKTENSLRQMEDRVAKLESVKGGCACTIS